MILEDANEVYFRRDKISEGKKEEDKFNNHRLMEKNL